MARFSRLPLMLLFVLSTAGSVWAQPTAQTIAEPLQNDSDATRAGAGQRPAGVQLA
jgi:hypothetical protein